jgi:hypothetical protein
MINNKSNTTLFIQRAIKRAEFLCKHNELIDQNDEFFFLHMEHIAIHYGMNLEAQYLNYLHEKIGSFYRGC